MARETRFKIGGWPRQTLALASAFAALFGLFAPGLHPILRVSLALVGTAGAIWILRAIFRTTEERYRVFPTVLTVVIGAFALVFATFLANRETEYLRTLVRDQAKIIVDKLEFEVKETTNALHRFARRIEYLGIADEKFLRLDGASYISQMRGLRRIGVVDRRLIVRWSYPDAIGYQVNRLDQSVETPRREVFTDAIAADHPSFSHLIDLRSGEPGFILPIPMHDKSGRPSGALYGTVAAATLFGEVARGLNVHLRVRDGDRVVFTNDLVGLDAYAGATRFKTGLADWTVEVSPTREFVTRNRSGLSTDVAAFGLLLALLIGAIAQVSAGHAHQKQINSIWRNAVLNGANYAIISTDIHGIIQTFNHSAERLLGYDAAEVIDRVRPSQFHLEDELAARAAALTEEFGVPIAPGFQVFTEVGRRTGQPDTQVWTYVRKDGTHVPVSLSVSTLDTDSGRVYGYIGVAVDLTERRRAEAQLLKTNERLERVIEATGSGIWERDYTASIPSYIDARGREIYGFGPDEVVTYETTMAMIHPDDHEHVISRINDHIEQRTPRFVAEFRIQRRDKVERWLRIVGQAHRRDSLITTLTATINDVTAEVRNRQRLETALADARSATEAKSAFVANMSHEIRTPLNGILGLARLVQRGSLDDESRENLDSVVRSGENLLTIINDILDFAKVDAGKMVLEDIDFDLARLLADTQKILVHSAREKDLALVFETAPDLVMSLRGDPGRLGQIVINLIGNAIKFTSHGEVRLRVSSIETPSGEYAVRFEVTDTGIGISADAQARVFHAFSQADISTTRNFGGTGLGLSISKRLVELMRGEIGVRSELGRGSTFWFEIPMKRGDARTSTSVADAARVRTIRAAKILVAEDNVVNQKVAAATLRKLGYVPTVVVNGLEAVHAVEREHFDLVLMDCQMPELDGFEATRRIRAETSHPRAKIPIVAMTANVLGEVRERCREAGMDDYISKPFDIDVLHAMIERILGETE